MKTNWRSLAFVGVLTFGGLGLTSSSAHAQVYGGFTYATPRFSVGVGTVGPGYYGGVYPGYPVVASPYLVAPGPRVFYAPPPVVVRPGGLYGGFYGPYRPFPGYYGYGRRYYR